MTSRFSLKGTRRALSLTIACWAVVATSLYAQDGPEEPAVTSPLVRRLLDETQDTPGAQLRAVLLMIDADHAFAARGLLEKLVAAGLDDGQLMALKRQFGTAAILKLAAETDLQPQARQLSLDVLAAARRMSTDSARIATLIKQLRTGSRGARRAAIIELRRAGASAVGPLLAVLADPRTAADHPRIITGLVALGKDALGPLTATLESPNSELRIAAIRALGVIDEFDTVAPLLYSVYDGKRSKKERAAAATAVTRIAGSLLNIDESLHLLRQRINRLLRNTSIEPTEFERLVDVWRWDDTAAAAVVEPLDRQLATAIELSRIAGIAVALDPEDPVLRRTQLGAVLETTARRGTIDVKGIVEQFGIDALDDLLRHSIDGPQLAGVTLAVQLLGEHGGDELLYRDAPRPAPLVLATMAGDRRLRFAAIEAIMKLNPRRFYPGRSGVIDALAYLASGYGPPRALIATTDPARAFRLGGYLSQLGYVTETFGHPGDLVRRALATGDCELVLIDVRFLRMTAGDAISQLRSDGRTKKLPVGVVASAELEPKALRLVRRYPLVGVMLDVDHVDTVAEQVDRIRGLAGQRATTEALRRTQAFRAITHMPRLRNVDPPIDLVRVTDVVMAAVDDPEMAPKAISILRSIGTPTAQRRLVDVASQMSRPIDIRHQAAKAFINNVLDHGTQLTRDEILRQYDRYNASRNQAKETQRVLGLILDAIEARGEDLPEPTDFAPDNPTGT